MANILDFIPFAKQITAHEFAAPCPECMGTDRFRIWPEKGKGINTTDIESSLLQKFSANKEDVLYEKKVATEKKKLDNSIQIQAFIVDVKPETWGKIHAYFQENRQGVSLTDMDVLASMVAGKIRLASPNQSKCLYRLYCNAKGLGLIL